MQGDGAMVGVAGPAGIGKTRLAAERGKIAVGGGHRFLRGRCLPNAGIFQPFVDIVRTAWDRADHDERRHMIGERSPGSRSTGPYCFSSTTFISPIPRLRP